MLTQRLLIIALLTLLTAGCENFSSSTPTPVAPEINNYQKATPAPPQPVRTTPKVYTVNPNQLLHAKNNSKILDGTSAVDEANKKSVVAPTSSSTQHSIIVYPFDDGELYQIYTTPLNITDVEFQANEEILSVAAGDTVRWQISKTLSGSDSNRTEHLFIKPAQENLDTTLVVTTNQRTYHILLKSTKNTFMSTVKWQYNDQKNISDPDSPQAATDGGLSLNPESLDFAYHTKLVNGDMPDWMPKAIFNDGIKTYIEFPSRIQSAPTLFIKQSGSGDAAVNYRVVGHYYVIDQVISKAELMSGSGRFQTIVSIDYKK